ncbi:MAG: hypothetical protein PVF58_15535 [Candidatus Methanofastidiosia archaeon]|jgi:hypothetical protein
MLIIRLKNKKEFQKVCQGKCVYFSENGGTIQYFTPARINDVKILHTFTTTDHVPLREHYDLEDTEGVYVHQLIEIDNVYCLDPISMACTEIRAEEFIEAY